MASRFALGAIVLLSGCVGAPREEEDATPPPTTANDSSSPTSTASGTTDSPTGSASATSSTTDDANSSSGEIKLDVGGFDTTNVTAGDTEQGMGCKKVDFMFIIDNSGSMGDEQDNLIASFPGFIETIQTTIDDAQDYHIMVLDTDDWVYGGCEGFCGLAEACIDQNGFCNPFADFSCVVSCGLLSACEGYQCGITQPLECEDVLGAGVVHPRGGQASNQDCNFSSGARYMDSSEPDLAATFACAADVGTGSTSGTERPMGAMVQAVTPNTEADACNEGFIRDDAILVVTFITDEDDNGDSEGTVEGWRQALIAAKGGDESAVVVLGLFGDQDKAGAICEPLDKDSTNGAEPSRTLRQFVNSWGERGFAGSVCADSYEGFFEEAVGIIDTTCEEFIPPEG